MTSSSAADSAAIHAALCELGPTVIVLHSGGIDSTVVLTAALRAGLAPVALSVDYGQRHRHEIVAARRVSEALGVVEHQIVALPFLGHLRGSTLTDLDLPLIAGEPKPTTYVPGRNLLLLAHALALAEARGSSSVLVGSNADDAGGYPDCRPAFFEAVSRAATLGTRVGEDQPVRVAAPLVLLDKARVVALGLALDAPLHLTSSCYGPAPSGRACGWCDACRLREAAFAEAGVADPAEP